MAWGRVAARAAPWSGDMAPWGPERGAGRVLMSAAPPPALRRSCQPPTGSPDSGAYASRYRDREHVNE